MGLRDTISKATQTAFVATGDIPVDVVYYQPASSVYDVSSGTASAGVSTYLFSMIFTSFKSREIDGEHILATDQKGLAAQANVSTIPQADDWLMVVENGVSVRYDVVAKGKDPADAHWALQLRKP